MFYIVLFSQSRQHQQHVAVNIAYLVQTLSLKMEATEVDTFIRKFYQLWNSGYTAHLDIDTCGGKAWVGLRLHLDHFPGPQHQQPVHLPSADTNGVQLLMQPINMLKKHLKLLLQTLRK